MMTRRTEDGALKCAFLDLRREDARAVWYHGQSKGFLPKRQGTNSTCFGTARNQQQGNIIPALSLVILSITEGLLSSVDLGGRGGGVFDCREIYAVCCWEISLDSGWWLCVERGAVSSAGRNPNERVTATGLAQIGSD